MKRSVLGISLWAAVLGAAQSGHSSQSVLRGPEAGLRKRVIREVIPTLDRRVPSNAPKKGVIVVQLRHDPAGIVDFVTVLESPSPVDEAGIVAAVKQWRFLPVVLEDGPAPVIGKLTFYYELKGSRYVLRNPRRFAAPDPPVGTGHL